MSWRAVAPTGVLLIFPLTAVLLFFVIPADQQMLLALDHRQPRWYQFVTAVVVHRDAEHLWTNVIGFAFAYAAWMQLVRLGGQAARGRKVAVIAVIVGPIATTMLSLLAYDAVLSVTISLDRGMSGMVGMMSGLLIYEVVLITMRAAGGRLGALLTGGYILVMLLTLETLNGELTPALGWTAVAAIVVGGGGGILLWGRGRLKRWARVHPELFYTLLVAVPWSVFLFVALLPASMQGPGGMTNVVAHGGGILLGMLIGQIVRSDQVPIPAERPVAGS